MPPFYKAIRPNGTDFQTGTINYAAATGGHTIALPHSPTPRCHTDTVLHASPEAAETLTGIGTWPCRLLLVEGHPVTADARTRGFFKLTVHHEVDAAQALGPNAPEALAIIAAAQTLTTHTQATTTAPPTGPDPDKTRARTVAREAAKTHALARRTAFDKVAAPGEVVTIHTDAAGDRLDISASGHGRILVEILPADPALPGASVELPEEQVLAIVGAAVRASGKSPEQLRMQYHVAQQRKGSHP